MATKDLQILLILILGPLGLYVTHYEFVHSWIWVLPTLGLLAFFELPPLPSCFRVSSSALYLLSLIGSGLVLTTAALQNPTSLQEIPLLHLLGFFQIVGVIALYWTSSKKQLHLEKFFLFSQWALMGAYLWVLIRVSQFPVIDIFSLTGWNKHGLPIVLRKMDFTSFDVRFLFIGFHLLNSLLVFTLTERSSSLFKRATPSLLFLMSPLAIFYIERNWNDSLAIFILLTFFFLLQKGWRKSASFTFNILLILVPEFFVLTPLLFKKIRRSPQGFLTCALSVGPAVLFWAFYLSQGLAKDSTLVPAQNPLGAWTVTEWSSRFLQISAPEVIPLVFLLFSMGILLWILHKKPHLLENDKIFFSLIGFASLAYLDHFWLSFVFFYLSFSFSVNDSRATDSKSLSMGWPLFIFVATRFFLLFSWNLRFTDTIYYLGVADRIVDGAKPYVQFVFEYPPLSLIPILIPKFMTLIFHSGENFLPYRSFHSFLYFCIDLLMMLFLLSLYHRKKIPLSGLILYIGGGLLLGELIYDRLDLLLGLFFMMGTYYISENRFLRSSLFLLVGVFLKLIPVILFPFIGLHLLFKRRLRFPFTKSFWTFVFFGFGLFGINYLIFGSSFLHFMDQHENRGIQLESTWSSLYYFLQEYWPQQFAKLRPVNIYGAYHLYEPPSWILKSANIAPVVSLLALYAVCLWKKLRGYELPIQKLAFFAVLLFIVSCKVFSPQYLLWLVCLMPLCGYRLTRSWDALLLTLYGAALLLTATLFHDYMGLVKMNTTMWNVLNSRNALLILLGVFVFIDIFMTKIPAATQKPEV